LPRARVLVSRYEELDEEITPVDIVCSRAIGELPQFLNWAASDRINAKTVMLWIGGRDLDEARSSKNWIWDEPVAIPQSLRRFILVGNRAAQAES
jgi:16S rRNA G527 N7-methylase RsmG